MPDFNFHNKQFALVENSEKGTVNSDTIFKYQQNGNLVTADYHGGTVTYGKIIADLRGEELHMLYQCLTTENELKAGKAIAKVSMENGKLKLQLDWEWLSEKQGAGKSEYIEI